MKQFVILLLSFLTALFVSCGSTDSMPSVPRQDITGKVNNNEIIFDVTDLQCSDNLTIANKTRTKATFKVYSLNEDNSRTYLGSRTLGGDNTEPIRPQFSWEGIKTIIISVEPKNLNIAETTSYADRNLYVKFSKFLPFFEYSSSYKTDNAFLLAKMWIAEKFNDSNSAIKFEDKDAGIIISKASFLTNTSSNAFMGAISMAPDFRNSFGCNFKILLKDNTATISFYDFSQNASNENTSYDELSVRLESLAQSLFDALQ